MSENPPKKLHMGEGPADKKAAEKEAKQYALAQARPLEVQTDMFDKLDTFWKVGQDESRTFDLFDALPKFHFAKQRNLTNTSEFAIYRSTTYKDRRYTTTLTPAIVTNSGTKKTKVIYPGEREELVERALRKMAVQQLTQNQEYLDAPERDFIRLTFTLYQLRKELSDSEHSFDYEQLKEALQVLTKAILTIETDSDDRIHGMESAILPNLQYSYAKKDKSGKECFVSVTFHALAVEAIKKMAHYPINYRRMMSLTSPLSRWFYTRLSHNYRQASRSLLTDKGWTISLATVLEESGIVKESRLTNSISTVRNALEELKTSGVLSRFKPYEERTIFDDTKAGKGRKPISNVHWTLHPSSQLVTEIIEGNAKMAAAKTSAASKVIEMRS